MAYGLQTQYPLYQARPVQPVPGYTYRHRGTAPVAVHVVAILQYVSALIMLGSAALIAYLGSELLSTMNINYPPVVGHALLGVAAVIAVSGLIAVLLGRKLQRGRNWARVLVVLFSLIHLAAIAYGVYAVQYDNWAQVLTAAFFPVLNVVLLNTKAARSWFRYRIY